MTLDINWITLKSRIMAEPSFIDKYGDQCKQLSLGKVSDLTPSGKHRDFGRPGRDKFSPGSYKGYLRVTDIREVDTELRQDMEWWKKLREEARKHDIYTRPSDDKNRTFIMAGLIIEKREGW